MKKILLFMVSVLLVFGMVSCDQEVKTNTYKVTYNANGAVGNVPASIEVEEGGTITVSSQGLLSMKGYDFVGWNMKKDGSGKAYKESQSIKVDYDIVLYAQWSIHEYSISYELNGGSYPEDRSNPTTYTIETESFTLNSPEKDGYEFLGWKTSEGEEPNKNVSIGKGTTGDLLFIAVWRPLNSYSISYDLNGGEGSIGTVLKLEGESAEISSDSVVSRKGYEFLCWNTESDGTGKDYNSGDLYKEDANLQLYAKWSIIKYSIEYFLIDGELAAGKSNPVEYTVETSDTVLENPTKHGCEFVGWRYKDDSDASASTNFSIKKGTTGNLSIVAVWKALGTYTISYDANGGTGTIETQSEYKGTSLTISSSEGVERVGYTFFCWNTEKDGTGKDYKPNDTYSADTDLRLYAKWNPVKYSIKYDLDGGTFSDGSSITEYTIETDTFTLPIPTKAEYGFIGWKAKVSDEVQKAVSIEKGSTGNLSFTAVWRKLNRYTVSYDVNGGFGSIESQSKLEGSSITISDADGIERVGYSFVCWNTKSDGSGTDYEQNDVYGNDEDLVLYAKWNPIKYSITYDLAGGTLPEGKSNPSDYTIETEAFTLVNPEKERYIFVGWRESGSKDETAEENVSIAKGSTGDNSFIAVWRLPKKYTVTFDAKGVSGGTPPDPLTVYEGDSFTIPSYGSIYCDSYVFCGWKTNSYGGTLYKPSEMVEISKDIVLYAGWYRSPLKYTYLPETDSYSIKYDSTREFDYFAIPPMYKGKPVSEIGDSAFMYETLIHGISIPSSVTSIGFQAFSNCSRLTSVTISEGVTSIGESAFIGCSGLTSIAIPESVTSIGSGAFIGCSGLTSITIPEGVTSIGEYAFSGCSGLTSVTISEGVTSIGKYAFSGCNGLVSITIPESVTSIGSYAFKGCSGLESIEVEAENSVYYSEGNCLIERDTKNLVFGCKNSVIPEDVTSIGEYVFYGCSGLTSIAIPEGVTSIGEYAFSGCSGLTSVTISEGVTSIGECAFSGCSGLTSIAIPEGVTSIGSSSFSGCSGLTSITIPESVTSIGEYAFSGCSGLTCSITVPDNVMLIGDGVFYGCSGLTSIMIPEGVTSIGKNAFRNCSSLTEITIPNGVVSIGGYAFAGCSGLTNIFIPASVATMGKYEYTEVVSGVFDSCNGLTVQFEEGMTEIPNYALYGSSGIVSVKIPSSVTSIGSNAFKGCKNPKVVFTNGMESIPSGALCNASGVVSVTIPESVTSIGSSAFSGCSGLSSIAIPEGVTSIGEYAFSGCSGLTSITIPEGVTSIGEYAFRDCKDLSIVFEEGMESIPSGALCNASGVVSVTIPESVTSIGSSAFYNCRGLTSIAIPEGVTSIGDRAFSGCSGLTSITIPEGVTSIGEFAFFGCIGLKSIEVEEGNSVYYSEENCLIERDTKKLVLGCKVSVIPEGVTSIGCGAFSGCSVLKSIAIPDNVTSIGVYAFSGCSELTSITIPSKVTYIERGAFRDCNKLWNIHWLGSKAQWSSISKADSWDYGTGRYTIHCTDGDIAKK